MMSALEPVVPFTLRVPGRSEIGKWGEVTEVRHHVHGLARLEGDALLLEWSGTTEHQFVGALQVRKDRVAIPVTRLAVPVGQIAGIELEGGWWRPRIALWATALDALAVVPGVRQGRVELLLARRDRGAARELVTSVMIAAADVAIAAAEASVRLPGR